MLRISETEEPANYAKARQSLNNLNFFLPRLLADKFIRLAPAATCHFKRSRLPRRNFMRRREKSLTVKQQSVTRPGPAA